MYVYEPKHAAVKPYNIQKQSVVTDNTILTSVRGTSFLVDPVPGYRVQQKELPYLRSE